MTITIKLIDMSFFDREQEFEKLREIEELSHEVAVKWNNSQDIIF